MELHPVRRTENGWFSMPRAGEIIRNGRSPFERVLRSNSPTTRLLFPSISPDGKSGFDDYAQPQANKINFVIPFAGSSPVRTFDYSASGSAGISPNSLDTGQP